MFDEQFSLKSVVKVPTADSLGVDIGNLRSTGGLILTDSHMLINNFQHSSQCRFQLSSPSMTGAITTPKRSQPPA